MVLNNSPSFIFSIYKSAIFVCFQMLLLKEYLIILRFLFKLRSNLPDGADIFAFLLIPSIVMIIFFINLSLSIIY